MPDIIVSVSLPSKGKIYDKEIQWQNQLRAPRLRDRGLGDTTRRLKLQAGILDKTLVQPLGISAYDLHTADFVYLNLMQRQLSKGNAPYKVAVTCKKCGHVHNLDIDLSTLEIKPLEEVKPLVYTTIDEHELGLTFITPRMLDECIDKANDFKEEYKDTDMAFEDLKTQELLRFVIKTVDGARLSYPRMTDFISNMYSDDVDGVFSLLNDFDFGVQFQQTMTCEGCGKRIVYTLPI